MKYSYSTLQTSPNSNEAPTDTPRVSFNCPTSPNLYLYLSMLICFSYAPGKVSKFSFWGPKKNGTCRQCRAPR